MSENEKARFPLASIAHRRKMFYDWLDRHRPWAARDDAYTMMESIVDRAALYFLDDDRPSAGQISALQDMLMLITQELDSHPRGHDGPCNCAECRSS